ncbi:MAG: manganese efflux pump MntP family protein [Eubacterium sp.]|nr:manganese efflux pump MntP family protein [Eubacterium sp.]
MDLLFFVNSVLLGVALAMDAFSVSVANGLNEPNMRRGKFLSIAGCFSFFQFLMPMVGWFIVCHLVMVFNVLNSFIPWIALVLLCVIGISMIREGLKGDSEVGETGSVLTGSALIVQGIATSIDALSVGLTISHYGWALALVCSLIIAAVTFGICVGGLTIGRVIGTHIASKAPILGGVILIAIGLEIFIKGIFF